MPRTSAATRLPEVQGIIFRIKKVSWQSLAVVELPLLALLAMIIAISVLVSPDFELRATGLSLPNFVTCPFFAITGIPCLFCGITRSFMAMGGLDAGQAFTYHPLGPFLYIFMLVIAAVSVVSLITGRRLSVKIGQSLRKNLLTVGVAILIASWIVKVLVWRQTGLL